MRDGTELLGTPSIDFGIKAAMVFALLAHRLKASIEDGMVLQTAQCHLLCDQWSLARQMRVAGNDRRNVVAASRDMLDEIMSTSSGRETKLFIAHELFQAIDPQYQSEIGAMVMDRCCEVLRGLEGRILSV